MISWSGSFNAEGQYFSLIKSKGRAVNAWDCELSLETETQEE